MHTDEMPSEQQVIRTPKRAKKLVQIVVCVFLATFAFSVSINEEALVVIDATRFQACLVCVVSIFLFYRGIVKEQFIFRIPSIILAVFFALTMGLGMQLTSPAQTLALTGVTEVGITGYTIHSFLVAIIVMVFAYAGFFCFYLFVCDLACSFLQNLSKDTQHEQSATVFGFPITFRTCVIVLFIAWLPYLIIYCPTAITSDASRQLAQFFGTNGLSLDTHFPYAVSVVQGSLYTFGCLFDPSGYLGMWLIVALQIVLGLLIFSFIILSIKYLEAPRWLIRFSLAFFALFPLVPVYMVSIGKDTLNAEFIALFVIQLFMFSSLPNSSAPHGAHALKKASHSMPKAWNILNSPAAICITAILVVLTRNNGIFLVIPALLIAIVLNRSIRLLIGSVCAVLLVGVFQFGVVPAAGVASAGSVEMLSMPIQVIGSHIAHGLPVSDEQREYLEDCFGVSVEQIGDAYNPDISDPVKLMLSNAPVGFEQATSLSTIALEMAAENPVDALGAALTTDCGMWYPFCVGTYWREDAPYANAPGDGWANPEWFASYEDLPGKTARMLPFSAVLKMFHSLPGFASLYAPGSYAWFIAFILCAAFWMRNNRRVTLCTLTPLVFLFLVMIFAPCSSLRYALPAVFSLPILILLCMTAGSSNSKIKA